MNNLGAAIRQKRMAQGLSLRALSELLNIDNSLLCRYELGRRNVSQSHFRTIVDYLQGEYDRGIMERQLIDLQQKYESLTGRKGLELWG